MLASRTVALWSGLIGVQRPKTAAIAKTKLTLSFKSKRHVLRADTMSGRTPNVNKIAPRKSRARR